MMEKVKLASAPISLKLFVTVLLCVIGLTYLALLTHIWIDTEMKVANIATAYGQFEFGELAQHSHEYLPYYAIYIFFFPTLVFLFTSYSEGLKRFFAVFPLAMTVVDIGSMWLIRYFHAGIFSWVLFFAGMILGLSFFSLFLLILYDIWLKKED